MAHALYRIKSKLVNTPHLIDSTAFEAVMEYVNKRCEDQVDVSPELSVESPSRYLYNEDSQTGVLYVDGPLTAKPTMFQALCGGTSYEGLKEDFEALAASGAKTVAMLVDSPGGEAHSMMDTADYLRKIADDNGIKIIAFVDGLSASAGYGLSVIADEIIATKDSELGSVGVLIRLMNDSKALEKEGYERTFISAGSEKIPFSADGSFRKEFLEDLQYKVDVLYGEFTSHVAKYRNMSVEAVIGTQAKTFLAGDAVELGLADKIMSQEAFYSYLAETAQKETTMTNRMFKFKSKEETTDMTQLADLQAQLQVKDAELSALAEKMEAFASAICFCSSVILCCSSSVGTSLASSGFSSFSESLMIPRGLLFFLLTLLKNSLIPNITPWSVTAIARIPSLYALSINASMDACPSSKEYWVCTCK